MKTQRLFDENFHLIPIRQDKIHNCNEHRDEKNHCLVCRQLKTPIFQKWQETVVIDHASQALTWLRRGYNLAVVAGEQSENSQGPLLIVDFDFRGSLSEVAYWKTLCAFSPHGVHVYFRGTSEQFKANYPGAKFDTLRYTAQYALIPPSKINGKAYWWLDNGRTEIRKL